MYFKYVKPYNFTRRALYDFTRTKVLNRNRINIIGILEIDQTCAKVLPKITGFNYQFYCCIFFVEIGDELIMKKL